MTTSKLPTDVHLEYLKVAALIYPHYFDLSLRQDESVRRTIDTIKLLKTAIEEEL